MKLGIVISTTPTSFAALRGGDFEENVRSVSSLGYDGVELAVRDPALVDAAAIKDTLDRFDLEVPAVGTGQAFLEEGLCLSGEYPAVRRKAVERLETHIEFASVFNAKVIIGLIRGGKCPASERKRKTAWIVDALTRCAECARRNEVTLLLEPINRYETDFFNTIEDAIKLLKEIGSDNVKLLIDTFHMNIEEPSLFGGIIKAMPFLGHVHFADSNRMFPGGGHIDFADILKVLGESKYDGYLSMEMLPLPSADKAAQMSINYLKNII